MSTCLVVLKNLILTGILWRNCFLFYTCRRAIDEQGGVVTLPNASAILHFPSQAVSKPVTVTCSVLKHKKAPCKPKKDEFFCSRIYCMDPEHVAFNKPVSVLLTHSAAEEGAYVDCYDVIVQQFKEEWTDLETQRIRRLEGKTFSYIILSFLTHWRSDGYLYFYT